MADAQEPPGLIFLDACCAINLLACGAAEEILRGLPFEFSVTPRVLEKEVLYVRDDHETESEEAAGVGAGMLEPPEGAVQEIRLQPLVDSGALHAASPLSVEELETFISLALELDDGEAETAAAAIHRGAGVATDDRKAIRVLGMQTPPVSVHRTSSLIKRWASASSVSDERVRGVLQAIEHLASFVPARDDPERGWWMRLVGQRMS